MNNLSLGIDLGSVSIDAVVLDVSTGRQLFSVYKRTNGRARKAVSDILDEIYEKFPEGFSYGLVTGSGKEIVTEFLEIDTVNEIVAHGLSASKLINSDFASVIEIGGQDSKYIIIDKNGAVDYSMNELCAAGTGSFLDVQADRLKIKIEDFAQMASVAANIPSIAGRCSVFAKSDIIHLQQKGVPIEEIAGGLCYALARNYLATMIRGKKIYKPILFQGGVAKNKGIIRAFKELLELSDNDYIIPENPGLMGALGSAQIAISEKHKIGRRINKNIKNDNGPSFNVKHGLTEKTDFGFLG